MPNWDFQVLDVVRGEQAWQMLAEANQISGPVPEGMEYLLVKIHVKSTCQDTEKHYITSGDFKLTGDRLVLYNEEFFINPEDELFDELASGEETEGWAPFLVGQGEGNLLLTLAELAADLDYDNFRFIALQEGASVQTPPDLASIEPTHPELNRSAPVPLGETVATGNWVVTVLEVVKGDDAWALVKTADESNNPPVEGMQYVAIRVRVRNIDTEEPLRRIANHFFKVTGDANVVYPIPSVVAPSPVLYARLYPGAEYEGWVVEQAAEGETNLMAVFQKAWHVSPEFKRYLALEDGASIASTGTLSELADIEPETTGTDMSSPAPLGESVTTEDWQIRVVDAIRGDQAWQMVLGVNQFSRPPAEGREYVAAKVSVRYIGTKDEIAHVDESNFSTIGSGGTTYDAHWVHGPDPVLDFDLFPGGEYEGWTILQIGKDETGLIAIFDPSGSAESEKRFLSLEP